MVDLYLFCFFFQAEDGIRDLVRSRGLGDVYKRQGMIEDVNPYLIKMLGYSHAEFIKKKIWELRAFQDLSLIHI